MLLGWFGDTPKWNEELALFDTTKFQPCRTSESFMDWGETLNRFAALCLQSA